MKLTKNSSNLRLQEYADTAPSGYVNRNGFTMNEYTETDLQEAKKAFMSSIGKCEKVLSKLKENSWQRKWTQRQFDAFHFSLAFIENTATSYSKEQLTEVKQTLNELVDKCKVMIEKLKEGSPQSTLAKRRLKAFLLVLSLIKS